jgi:hypothetical protein
VLMTWRVMSGRHYPVGPSSGGKRRKAPIPPVAAGAGGAAGAAAGGAAGRGLHSFTFQLNLSRFGHTSPCPTVY